MSYLSDGDDTQLSDSNLS